MINVFYMYGIIWLIILFLYKLGWSNLCIKLTPGILIFLFFSILSSMSFGYLNKKKLSIDIENKYEEERFNRNNFIITLILIILFLLSFVFSRNVPLVNVFKGFSYNSESFAGIPHLNIFISSFAIFYAFYLSVIFSINKNKKEIISFFLILLYFVLCYARQNIMIVLIILFNNLYLNHKITKNKGVGFNGNKLKNMLLTFLIAAIGLYVFGILGNARYGQWAWNDSSMVMVLGKANDKFPSWLPKEYFWAYIYMVTPLANLNYNASYFEPVYSFAYMIRELLPGMFFNNNNSLKVHLPVPSINASTGFVRGYLSFGYLGIYLIFISEMIIINMLIQLARKRDKTHVILTSNVCTYVFLFTFFTNTLSYPITSMLIVYTIIYNLNIKIKR